MTHIDGYCIDNRRLRHSYKLYILLYMKHETRHNLSARQKYKNGSKNGGESVNSKLLAASKPGDYCLRPLLDASSLFHSTLTIHVSSSLLRFAVSGNRPKQCLVAYTLEHDTPWSRGAANRVMSQLKRYRPRVYIFLYSEK